jgi:hypothetical protein
MAGIKSIKNVLSRLGEDKLREILSQEVRVTEKFDAFRFSFEKHPKTYKIQYYGKNGKIPLNRVDRTISDLYEEAIEYIENLPYEIRRSIPIRQRFGFSWFPTRNPLITEYEKRPRHGLILTDITVRNNKFEVINEVKESNIFERWASVFRVDYAKPVFEGKLTDDTVNALLESCKEPSLEMLKESEIYTPGFLNFNKESIEDLVFEFPDQLMKLGKDQQEKTNESRSHLFDILLLNICEHLENFDLEKIKVASPNPDEGYIEVVSEVFNDYVEKKGSEFLESGLKKPSFLEKSGDITKKWIKNPKTLSILESHTNYEYLFTIFLANLKKPRYQSGLISESVAQSFNQKIEEIDKLSGNDFGFLEFAIIQKEDKEPEVKEEIKKEEILKGEPDYVKAVALLTRFFDTDRNIALGKTPVNVIIANVNAASKDIIDEAERLKKLNGYKTVLVHSKNLHSRSYGIEEVNTKKILHAIVNDHHELFIGYKVVDRPFFKSIIDSLAPEYVPVTIFSEGYINDLRLEQDGLKAIYTSPSGLIDKITVEPLRISNKNIMQSSLEKDSFSDFKKTTPECMHPYWTEIKGSFDKYYYH